MIIELDDAKAHLNVTTEDDDTLIEVKIAAAEIWLEAYLGKPLSEFDPMPETLKEAARQLVAHWYECREATSVGESVREVPFGVVELVRQHREWHF